jgi:hypothetical protein
MQKILIALILSSLTLPVIAQPVVSPEKYSMWNNALYNAAQDPEKVQAGAAGASVTWDFSNLVKASEMKEEILPPSTTTYASTFPKANAVRKNTEGNLFFLDVQDGKNEAVGYVFQSEGLVIPYSDPMLLLKRPVAYQDAYSDEFADKYTYMGDNTKGGGTITVNADAYGTLMLPGKTYTGVLRVHSVQESTDTAQTSHVITTVRVETYAWYDASQTFSLMEIEYTRVDNPFFHDSSWAVKYMVSESLGLPAASQRAKLHSVHLDGDKLVLKGNFKPGADYNIVISNCLGQVLAEAKSVNSTGQVMTIDLPGGGKGIYFVSVLGPDNMVLTGSYIVQ